MKFLIALFLLVTTTFGQQQSIEVELRKCSSSAWVQGYNPQKFFSPDTLDWDVRLLMERNFVSYFGAKLAKKVVLAVGYKYNLDSLYLNHWDEIKDYQWEIPKYYLNYAFCDTVSGLIYCMEFVISRKGEIWNGTFPKVNEDYFSTSFISKEKAIYLIGKKRINIKKMKGFDFRNAKVVFDSEKGIFVWQFGLFDKIWVDAIPNGEIRVGKSSKSSLPRVL